MVYKVQTARAVTQRNPVLKNKNEKHKTNKQRIIATETLTKPVGRAKVLRKACSEKHTKKRRRDHIEKGGGRLIELHDFGLISCCARGQGFRKENTVIKGLSTPFFSMV